MISKIVSDINLVLKLFQTFFLVKKIRSKTSDKNEITVDLLREEYWSTSVGVPKIEAEVQDTKVSSDELLLGDKYQILPKVSNKE